MQTYSEYRPTSFDASGLGLEDQQDWLVLDLIQTRDSGPLELSNFEKALESLGGEGDDVEVHRFGHWGPGWFEIILINPEKEKLVSIAEDIERALADYPVLDEMHHSQLCNDDYQGQWDDWARTDFENELVRAFNLKIDTEYFLNELEDYHIFQEFYESLIPSGEYYIEESSGIALNIGYAVKNCTRKQLADFIRKARRCV